MNCSRCGKSINYPDTPVYVNGTFCHAGECARDQAWEDRQARRRMDRKEAFAALLFDSEVWTEDDPRPSEEACHQLAEELLEFLGEGGNDA